MTTNNKPPSLSSQLMAMQAEHRRLDQQIAHLHEFPHLDQLELQRLKREKLMLKQNIESVKSALIPDLNA